MNNKLEKVTAVLVGCGSISKEWFDAAGRISNLEIIGLVDLKNLSMVFSAIESARRQSPIDIESDIL